MEIEEQTWNRIARFWWAAAWRGLVIANLIGGALAGFIGITFVILGHKDWGSFSLVADILILAYIPGFLLATRLALRLDYRGFQIVFVRPNPTL